MCVCVESGHDLGNDSILYFLSQVTRNPVHIQTLASVSQLASAPSWTQPGKHQKVSLLMPSSLEAADPKVNSTWALDLRSKAPTFLCLKLTGPLAHLGPLAAV